MEDEEEVKESKEIEISVKILNVRGEAALVEYSPPDGGIMIRTVVPAKKAKPLMPLSELGRGLPYGLDLSDFSFSIDGDDLARKLHEQNIWTAEDVLTRINDVKKLVINLTVPPVLVNIVNLAKAKKQ